MKPIFNTQNYNDLILSCDMPKEQKHRSRWSEQEIIFLHEAASNNCTLSCISRIITLRTKQAIIKKLHELNYASTKNINGDMHFKEGVKSKRRRTNEEMLADMEKVPIKPAISVEDCDKESTVIIADESKVGNELNILQELNKLEVMFQKSIHAIKSIKKAL